jgi:hypothetical protein
MKKLLATLAFITIASVSFADHSDNGKCLDEIKHFQSLLKTSSASAEAKASAKAKRDQGNAKRVTGKEAECEALYKEAIALIQ